MHSLLSLILDIPIQLAILFAYSYIVVTVNNYLFQQKFPYKTDCRRSIDRTATSAVTRKLEIHLK